jgi:hypothetical protein
MAIFTMRLIQGHAFYGILLLGDFFLALAREKEKCDERDRYIIFHISKLKVQSKKFKELYLIFAL